MSFSLVQVVPRSSFAMGHEQGETFFAKSGARTKYSSFLPRTTTGGKMRCPKRTHVTPPTMNEDVDMSEDDERPSSTSIRDETKLINQTTSSPPLSSLSTNKIKRKERGTCYGCGVGLQTVSASAVGFVSELDYETKKKNKQLDLLLCSRCSNLSNGQMINAVVGQGGQKIESGLITPEELRETLKDIRRKKALVVKIVDLTDFHGSFLPKIRDLVGSNPILLVVTKCDVIGKRFKVENNDALVEFVLNECAKKRLTLAGNPIFR